MKHLNARVRILALGCTAAMRAILFHSLVDFQLYVPANALVLAWICGLTAGLEFAKPKT